MKVYAPDDFSWVTAIGAPVEKGEEVDVPSEVGEALVLQGWTSAQQKAARKTGRKRHAEAATQADDERDEADRSEPPADPPVAPATESVTPAPSAPEEEK